MTSSLPSPLHPRSSAKAEVRWIPALVFVGFASLLFAFSPARIDSMGYAREQMDATRSLLHAAEAILAGRAPDAPLTWSRHGALPLLYDAPFVLAGNAFPNQLLGDNRMLAIRPVLFTAGVGVLMFLWVWRVTNRCLWSLGISITGVFCTLLWPYAYIGLEDTQSFFLLLSGYLALTGDPFRSKLRAAAFALAAACAISSKATGIFLLPPIAFLAYRAACRPGKLRRKRLVFTGSIVFVVFVLSAVSRLPFWVARGGSIKFLESWWIGDLFYYPANLVSFFFSANKGLFFYCPVLLLLVCCVPGLWRAHRPVLIFALLSAAGIACGYSFLRDWADETWGPRYLHCAIAPAMICIGIGWRWRTLRGITPLAATAFAGFTIAFLGSFFYYGSTSGAMTEAGQNTLEAIQDDIVWNPLRFDAKLFQIWISGTHSPVWMTPQHQWFYKTPAPQPPSKPVNMTPYATPQPNLIRFWKAPLAGARRGLRWAEEGCLVAGFASLGYAMAIARRQL